MRGRRDGFCKDFYGRKHQLPPKIVEKLYPKKEDLRKCPEIKKFEEKPQVKQSDVKPRLESFMHKCMKCPEDTRVISISRQKKDFMVLTTSTYCETIGGNHDGQYMSYAIKKYEITQKCPMCTRGKARTYRLNGSIVKTLYPN